MKRFVLPILLAMVLLAGCNGNKDNSQSTKKSSSGKTLEVLFIADKNIYQKDLKPIVDSLFRQPQKGLPQPEAMFDLVYIPTSSFQNTEMFHVHRNIISCDIRPDNPDKVFFVKDQNAAPQVTFDFACKTKESFDSMLIKYYPTIVQEIYRAEYRRIAKAFRGIPGKELMDQVKEKYGFSLTVSDEFELARMSKPGEQMSWIRKEAKDFGIGVLIDIVPYTSEKLFEESNILALSDSLMKHVEGPADSSYMGVERRLKTYTQQADFSQSSYAVQTSGCWRLFGDFMGGPFVTYAILTPDKKNVVLMVAYVYCPRLDKRDYLMQVQGICHSIKF